MELPTNPTAGENPVPSAGTPSPAPTIGSPPFDASPPSDEATAGNRAPSGTSDSSPKTAKVLKIVGIVIGCIILLVVIGMLIAIMSHGSGRPVKRSRRRFSRYGDDDDD